MWEIILPFNAACVNAQRVTSPGKCRVKGILPRAPSLSAFRRCLLRSQKEEYDEAAYPVAH